VKGVISIEGQCTTTLSQPQLAVLAKIPALVIFGDHLTTLTGSPGSAGLWQGAFAGCPQFIQQVNSAGGDATMLFLPHAGQFGNSHMLMQDKNNLVVPI
jgi:hypothetical protein